jgi:ketosteroid isomerase-like protein
MTSMADFVRRWAATALIAAIACVTNSAQSVRGPESDLAKIEDEWIQARLKGDVTYLERLYAPELRITGADGSVIERNTDIARFASGAIKPQSMEREDMRITVYGDAAVVIGRDNLKGSYNGVSRVGSVRFTHVYVRRDGRWQLVASQGTWVQAK